MLNKRHCSPAKGLKGGRHCALSPVLIVVDDDDDDDDAGDDYDDEEEEEEEDDVAESAERGGRRVVAENTYLLIPTVAGTLCSKQIRHPRDESVRHPLCSTSLLVHPCHLPFRPRKRVSIGIGYIM